MDILPDLSLGLTLVLCLFFFLAGFVDAIAGGGGLISTPAMLVCGLAVYLLKYFTHIENFLNGALFMAGGTLLFGSVYWCVYAAIGTTYSYFYAMSDLLPQVIGNVIVGLAVYFVLIENVKKQRRDRYYR